MLGTHENPNIMRPYYKSRKKKTFCINGWLSMTTSLFDFSMDIDFIKKEHCSKLFYNEINNNKEEDFACCLQKLQYHKPGAFCMQKWHVLWVNHTFVAKFKIKNFGLFFLRPKSEF